jgi:hypothetical protein
MDGQLPHRSLPPSVFILFFGKRASVTFLDSAVALSHQKELSHTINLHPSFFGPRTEGYLKEKLNRDVEGTCTGSLSLACILIPLI